ncbi:Fur family transcriptional regulator [Phycicoccus sp. M110.8]|uniref:Fur family transcriptional regulator n=1 Tax=Phycicoccus sp. M110.8 TaxID=3075433 RepID=UPI0028FD06E2|nr:Fur family transcriptional regulator [Phycicoccus sp. M110.8]MDU0313341.1 Fur family transcriptional regulator [Phycicoccus sp. M110.8]
MQDVGEQLRAQGLRMTSQRRRVLDVVTREGHVTPDRVVALVAADGGQPLAASTVYRSLEALESLGVVAHTHLDHRAPSYHLADHAGHVHLVCRRCGRVEECPEAFATEFVGNVLAASGFVADVTHMAVHGECAECSR